MISELLFRMRSDFSTRVATSPARARRASVAFWSAAASWASSASRSSWAFLRAEIDMGASGKRIDTQRARCAPGVDCLSCGLDIVNRSQRSAAEFSDKAPARKIQTARPAAARGPLPRATGTRSPLFTGKRLGAALARTEPRIGPAPTRQAPLLPSCRPSPMPVNGGDRGGGRGSLKSRQ